MHRRCTALLKDRSDADDALQEVFVRVHRYGRDDSGHELAWLYRVAANCCFDLLEKKKREQPAGSEELNAARSSGTPHDADRRAVLGAVLASLDAKTREIGLDHFLGGYTQEEVADRTGYSRKTVGKKLGLFEAAFTRLWLQAQQGGAR